jgi:hypothetical protein
VRLTLVDASGKPLASRPVELRDVACRPGPCRWVVVWTGRAGADGSVAIPRTLIHEGESLATPDAEPRGLDAARWRQDRGGWVLGVMGHAGTMCAGYDEPTTILVADDWRTALVTGSDEFGLMTCSEATDAFRTCSGPQVPDAGLSATFTRTGDQTTARLTGESIAGPRELARLDCWRLARGESPPRRPASFALEYSLAGGSAALDRHLRLTPAGTLDVSTNANGYATVLHGRASPELISAVSAFLEAAEPAPLRAPTRQPSAADSSLALIAGGARYELALQPNLVRRLGEAITSQLQNAVVGNWREAAWKLCRPAATLAADQMDASIDWLAFERNGAFSVTWQGGGGRVYGDPTGTQPHTALPDYSGRYELDPDRGRIRLTFGNGIDHPRDFSGEGFFRIAGDTLGLEGVWLGTYKAKKRPDICELSFVRIGR